MAQPGRNGHHDDNDGSHFVFNPMTFNYHQNQVFTPPTVLSQQDATVMADFFNNPDTANTNEGYLSFGLETRGDLISGTINNESGVEGDASLANTTISHVTATHGLHDNTMLHSTRPPFSSYDFNTIFMPDQHQPTSNPSGGDAVAGASALIGLSTSQEQSNLLNASNYMTWGNIVGAQTVAGPIRQSGSSATPRSGTGKSNSTSQLPAQMQSPSNQANSWAEITNQTLMQQRSRHSSLQLDTSATLYPNHQSAWQNAPQSAFPQPIKRNRPNLAAFGTDSRFSSHGFAGSAQHSPEQKYNNLMHLANIGDIALPQASLATSNDPRPSDHSFQTRHSIAGPMQTSQSTQSSPATTGGLPTPANSVGAVTSQMQSRKRGASHLDDEHDPARRKLEPAASPAGKQAIKRRKSGAQQAHYLATADTQSGQAVSRADTEQAAANSAPRNRRAAREQKPPRQNLTDEQKRNNHIASEQKRRDAMKTNFEILNRIVPALNANGAGLSRSEILQHTGNALESCKAGNVVIAQLLDIDISWLDQQPGSDDEDDEDSDD